ncbi:MAG: ABC transporter substrate-binding protein [Erysipelotrichaceae bacterium]|nr:ABC transporter substrate-binding protein [Erysipelotrichaceae bacterium]MDY5727274.1 ABC transporter substrate-binding protein [Erysipelotrichaceae bacterium]
MKSLRKALTVALASLVVIGMFAGCAKKDEEVKVIRYLNFKPEIADIYEEISKAYEAETGIKVIVDTAANNTYEQTLISKMANKEEAPTLFQINGPRGYNNWKDYCADLTGTELYAHLSDKSLAVTVDGKAYGIPYVVEGYGIIYNKAITDKYFALPNKATSYTSMEEVNNYAALKAVVEDMQANKEALGIEGVFASTSLKAGEDWRWQTHLANLPVYYEFKTNNVDLTSDQTKTITFQYSDNFKNIFDLYLNNSTIEPSKTGTKTVNDSMAEFALEKCAMVQNGNWAWGQVAGVDGNKVLAENVKYLPIYTGVEGEESQGLCTGTENFFCINAKASEAEQKAAADFIYWLYSSTTGKDFVTNKLGFIAPFDTFEENEKPTDPLAKEVLNWMSKDGVTSVAWNFTLFPSQTFKDNFGSALLQYAQGTKTWEEVKTQVVNDWASESVAAE